MLKKDLILRNPLRLIGSENEDILPEGGFGAVLARSGVGKTAILVQIALDSLLQSRNVLHISLADPVKKVCLWYEEVFRNIAQQYHIRQTEDTQLWETILPHRLIMTFNVDSFSVPKLEERLQDLAEQDIFLPQIVLIDGLPFDSTVKDTLSALKTLAKTYSLKAWFTIRIRRDEETNHDGVPKSFSDIAHLFDTAFQLQPREKKINIVAVAGKMFSEQTRLCLDPSTLLIMRD